MNLKAINANFINQHIMPHLLTHQMQPFIHNPPLNSSVFKNFKLIFCTSISNYMLTTTIITQLITTTTIIIIPFPPTSSLSSPLSHQHHHHHHSHHHHHQTSQTFHNPNPYYTNSLTRFHSSLNNNNNHHHHLFRFRSGHHPELKYWLAKINRAVDTICRKCGLGDETAEHAIYKCPRIHRPPAEPPPSDTMELNPKLTLIIWDKWKSMSDLSNISQPQPLLH